VNVITLIDVSNGIQPHRNLLCSCLTINGQLVDSGQSNLVYVCQNVVLWNANMKICL